MRKSAVRLAIVILALMVMSLPAIANSANYSWDMAYTGRYVNGYNNGVTHSLTAGTLTNSGSLWEYFKSATSNATPWDITIEVEKVGTFWDTLICYETVTPSITLNQSVSYNDACGSVTSGTYYLIISKPGTDGWSTAGNGTLTTQ